MPKTFGFGSTCHLKLARSVRAAGAGQDARYIVSAVKDAKSNLSTTELRKTKRKQQELKDRIKELEAELHTLENSSGIKVVERGYILHMNLKLSCLC